MKSVSVLADEPLVRSLLHRMLERKGFTLRDYADCTRPQNPGDCELACCPDDIPPDLLVVEIVVPRNCSGVEIAGKSLIRWPGLKILLTSGTPVSFWPPAAKEAFSLLPEASCRFLAKPFTAGQFDAALHVLGLSASA
jgi:hypothetical protein